MTCHPRPRSWSCSPPDAKAMALVCELLTLMAGDYAHVSDETLRGAWNDLSAKVGS